MNRFNGRRLRIGRHRPSFFGVRKNVAENRGNVPSLIRTTALFRRSSISCRNARALDRSRGTGVVLIGAGGGGGEVNSKQYPSRMVRRIHWSPVTRLHSSAKNRNLPPTGVADNGRNGVRGR